MVVTSLDTNYLNHLLANLTDQQKLAFITPPPSVINAYFAEIYQNSRRRLRLIIILRFLRLWGSLLTTLPLRKSSLLYASICLEKLMVLLTKMTKKLHWYFLKKQSLRIPTSF